ncbi:putative site-specific DNA methylase [Magnetospirillum fulvum MGU-K5]|uniref:DNA (cytosine-5-)-methyltransferase n=1 Tax=Magnetospirillum fulvum MGU-K5 TaxID=1316936 RepID=S9SFJ1_MAGFU|nr:putative site-specific DNA methylase [Magnetospirillum fulvum MGU-K5]
MDILTAGYPCQPFSTAGKRRGVEDPRHLWPHVARIVGEVRPGAVFLENVPNHLRLGFREVVDDLGNLGYRVAAGLFAAAEVGASHERLRLFVLAHRVGDGQPRPPVHAGSGEEGSRAPHPGGEGAAMAHSLGGGGDPGAERAGRETRPDPGGSGAWPELADSDGGDGARARACEPWPPGARLGPIQQSNDLANSEHGGCQRREQIGPRFGENAESALPHHQVVADSPRRGRRQDVGGNAAGRQPGPGQQDVADAQGPVGRGQQPAGRPERGRAGPSGSGACLAFAQRHGWLPLFAPGPSSDIWSRILEIDPALEPSLCRMAHAMAHRVDRLRLCGNGVSPLAGAFAYRTLRAALTSGDRGGRPVPAVPGGR